VKELHAKQNYESKEILHLHPHTPAQAIQKDNRVFRVVQRLMITVKAGLMGMNIEHQSIPIKTGKG
jgi:hypothetical protein